MFNKILLATDGSSCSISATKLAAQMAGAFNAQLHILNVSVPYPYLTQDERDNYNRKAQENAHKIFSDIQLDIQQPNITTLFKEGKDAAEVIIATAAEIKADVIVLGSHGYSGMNLLVLGSVANTVVTKAKCPVLVCKSAQEE